MEEFGKQVVAGAPDFMSGRFRRFARGSFCGPQVIAVGCMGRGVVLLANDLSRKL